MNKLQKLNAALALVTASMRTLNDSVSAGDNVRDFTAEEQAKYDGYKAEASRLKVAIERETELVASEVAAKPLAGAPANPAETRIDNVRDRREDDPQRGFRGFGDFARSVQAASLGNGMDERLNIGAAAPGTYGNEYAGSDGGFLVPSQYATDIFMHSLQEGSLLPLCDTYEIESNSMVFPKDETSPWGTDGIRAYWQAEGGVPTATKPKLSTTTLRLNKLMALVPISDELLAESTALGQYLPRKIGDSIRWKMNEAILWGLGNGTPAGILAASNNALVVQAKEGGQTTLTLNLANVSKMYARMLPNSISRAVWLINNDVLQQLFQMTLGNMPMYLPVTGAIAGVSGVPPGLTGTMLNTVGSQVGLLFGRPVYLSQHMSSLTTQGDIAFIDFGYVRAITKAGGMQTATSMHLYFDADATAFRTTFRVDTQPAIVNPVNPGKGSNTLSPYVTLQAR